MNSLTHSPELTRLPIGFCPHIISGGEPPTSSGRPNKRRTRDSESPRWILAGSGTWSLSASTTRRTSNPTTLYVIARFMTPGRAGQRPNLSDQAHEVGRFEPERDGRV